MSRLAKKPALIPNGVQVSVKGNLVTFKNGANVSDLKVHEFIDVKVENSSVYVSFKNLDESNPLSKVIAKEMNKRQNYGILGTTLANIKRQIQNVTTGCVKRLTLQGVGYKASVVKGLLSLSLGYSHPIFVEIPKGLDVSIDKNVVVLKSVSQDIVASFAYTLKKLRTVEPYKGKGVRDDSLVYITKKAKKT